MKKLCVRAIVATAAFAGCTQNNEEGGRAGNDTFQDVVPVLATAVKQGEVQTVRIVLEPGAGLEQQVKVEVQAHAGPQIQPKEFIVLPGDKGDVQLTITVAKDAPLCGHKIIAKGTPDKGEPTEADFTIAVNAK